MGRVMDRGHPVLPKAGRRLRLHLAVATILLALSQTGCIGVGLTALGAGLGVGVGTATSYTLNGFAYRTFAAPLPKVERATLLALRNMGIQFEEREATEQGALIRATGNQRSIRIRLERVTTKTTRVRTVVRINTVLMDRATATEIIIDPNDSKDDRIEDHRGGCTATRPVRLERALALMAVLALYGRARRRRRTR